MNRELPKPMLESLRREAAPAAHPSADVLTAFVERALSSSEKQRVTDHLGRCAECREIVFLASNAAREPVAEVQERLVAAAAPRRKWALRMIWAVAAAALLIVGFFVRQRFVLVRSGPQLAANMAGSAPAPPPAESRPVASQPLTAPAATKPGPERQMKTARTKNVPPKSLDTLAKSSHALGVADQSLALQSASSAGAIREPAPAGIGGQVTAVAPVAPRANGFLPGESARGTTETNAVAQFHLTPQASNRAFTAMRPQWRVTAEGHLEHFVQDGWMRVLASETIAFRVVSLVGNDVWVGGEGGAFFHSSDGGQRWTKVPLATAGGTQTSAIVSIQFDDPQHGVVTTESGLRYSTSDGGRTWTEEKK